MGRKGTGLPAGPAVEKQPRGVLLPLLAWLRQVIAPIPQGNEAGGPQGTFPAGNARIIEWLRQRGRPFLFSSAVTIPDVAACLASVDLLEESTELVDRLWANARFFQEELRKLGFDTGLTQTPITPVMLGDVQLAREFSRRLFDEGIFAISLGFPTVPIGKARIRVMISAAHTQNHLEQALGAFERVGKQLGKGA